MKGKRGRRKRRGFKLIPGSLNCNSEIDPIYFFLLLSTWKLLSVLSSFFLPPSFFFFSFLFLFLFSFLHPFTNVTASTIPFLLDPFSALFSFLRVCVFLLSQALFVHHLILASWTNNISLLLLCLSILFFLEEQRKENETKKEREEERIRRREMRGWQV